jgi:hypothetical protein
LDLALNLQGQVTFDELAGALNVIRELLSGEEEILKHPVKLEKFVHAILLDLFVFVLELLAAAAPDYASTQQIQVSADLIVIPAMDQVLRVFVAENEELILDIQLQVLRRVDPDVGLLSCALLLLSLSVVLLLHGGVSEIGIWILGLLVSLLS